MEPLSQLRATIQPEAVAAHVRQLADVIGERNVFRPSSLSAAAAYIRSVWTRQGYEVGSQSYEELGLTCENLEVTRQGTQADQILLIGAHYDSVEGSPGANDNASGVAALLELSRLFRQTQPRVSVRFVAFVNEEPPFFITGRQGSVIYARAARRRGDDIRLMIALETIGYYSDEPGSQKYPPFFGLFYPDAGNFLGFVSNFQSRRIMRRVARLFRKASDFPLEHLATFGVVPGVSWSDHRSFWLQGFPAFMVTDTALYRYPYYHSQYDTADRVLYPELARVTEGLFGAFSRLASEGFDGNKTT